MLICASPECQTTAGCVCKSRTPYQPTGWKCPNCGRAHGPDVATCPVDNRTLAQKIVSSNNG